MAEEKYIQKEGPLGCNSWHTSSGIDVSVSSVSGAIRTDTHPYISIEHQYPKQQNEEGLK